MFEDGKMCNSIIIGECQFDGNNWKIQLSWSQTSFLTFLVYFLSTLIIWKMSFDDVKKTRWIKVKIKNDWRFFDPFSYWDAMGHPCQREPPEIWL